MDFYNNWYVSLPNVMDQTSHAFILALSSSSWEVMTASSSPSYLTHFF